MGGLRQPSAEWGLAVPTSPGNYLEKYDPNVDVNPQGVIDEVSRAVELRVT